MSQEGLFQILNPLLFSDVSFISSLTNWHRRIPAVSVIDQAKFTEHAQINCLSSVLSDTSLTTANQKREIGFKVVVSLGLIHLLIWCFYEHETGKWWEIRQFDSSCFSAWILFKCRMAFSAKKRGMWILWKFLTVRRLAPLGLWGFKLKT